MKNKSIVIFLTLLTFLLTITITVNAKETTPDAIIAKYAKDKKLDGIFNADFSAVTNISYSAGDKSNWAYSHNKKKYSVSDTYLRISSAAITKHFWGKEKNILVYYIFTGVENSKVESYSGMVKKVKVDNKNVIVFEKTLSAMKKKNIEEEETIFKISPKKEGSLKLDVVYDEQVSNLYDESSTIDFRKNK